MVQIESIFRQHNKCIEKQKVILGWAGNIVGKEENAGDEHFLLFQLCFQNFEKNKCNLKTESFWDG